MIMPEKLQQIDENIIQLLGQRISLLATSEFPTIQEQRSNVQELLAQADVPEAVWNHILVHCMAALATAPAQYRTQPRRITLVGGRGAMGCFFNQRFSATGHQVSILEHDDWDQAETLLGNADLVLLCVPLKRILAIIRRVAPYLSENTVLADISSTKTEILQTMMACHAGPVVGLHPMFGPGVDSLLGQKVVVCPGHQPPACQWVLDWIESDGGQLITSTPEEHDRMMVVVQAIRFFSNFSLSAFLAEEGVDIDRSLEFASPLYRTEINTISRLVAQDAALYIDILLASDDRCQAIRRLVNTYSRLATLLSEGNRAALIGEFETARKVFRTDLARALRESNHTINSLSVLLAADEVETTQLSSKTLLTP